MGNGGGRIENYYARGMLEIRPTLHLAFRLTVRVDQVLERTGAASEGAGAWRVALPFFVLLDIAIWLILRRRDDFGVRWRLPLDALDAAFWTLSPLPASGETTLALLIAVPLAVEAGVRMGWRSSVVPASLLASTTIAGMLVAKPVQVIGVVWLVLAASVGMAFYRYCHHLDSRTERERRRFLAAARRRAYLAGQNDVAMGASSAVDVIEGLVPVLGRPASGSALWRLADGWKSQLGANTSQEAAYLHVALLEWERLHNTHPDLSGLVRIEVEEGHGTTLLSVTQVAQLRQALESLPLRGRILVRRQDADDPHIPGQELRLEVGGHSVVLPADRRASPSPLDPAAVAYYYVAVLVVAWLLPVNGAVAAPAVGLGTVVCVAAGFLSHRRTVAQGRRARVGVYVGAIAVSALLVALSTQSGTALKPDGEPAIAFAASLVLLSFLGGYYWTSLGRRRWMVPVSLASATILGLLVYPFPSVLNARPVAAALLYNVFPFFPLRHLSQALDRAAASHARTVQAVDADAERASFLEGRDSVVGLVRQAREDALDQLARLGTELDGGLAQLAARRLQEVEERLRKIEA